MVLDRFFEASRRASEHDLFAVKSPRVNSAGQANNSRITSPTRKKPSTSLKIPEILKTASLEEFFSKVENERSVSLES